MRVGKDIRDERTCIRCDSWYASRMAKRRNGPNHTFKKGYNVGLYGLAPTRISVS